MSLIRLSILAIFSMLIISCSDDDPVQEKVVAPAEYQFTRDGANTVSHSGQQTRILMAQELASALTDFDAMTEQGLLDMFANTGTNPFASDELNASTKSIRSKVAASKDLYSANTTESAAIKAQMDSWISSQATEVKANINQVAAPGTAGQIEDGTKVRYVSADGLEYNQAIAKSIIGSMMADQILNNYLSTAVLDEADNRTENTDKITAEGKSYTTMEHKWDEAYGYLFGNATDSNDPLATLGDDDSFLNKYLGRVDAVADFNGTAQNVYNAFKLGRAAIVDNDYELRDEQVGILRDEISKVIAIRAVHYLQSGKSSLESNQGGAFHALSEGFGFIYSLRFVRFANSNTAAFTRAEVDGFLEQLMGDGANGLWSVTATTLDAISNDIADKYNFTVSQAAL